MPTEKRALPYFKVNITDDTVICDCCGKLLILVNEHHSNNIKSIF